MKSWISSKTLWFNVLAAGLSVLIDSVSTAPIDPQYQVLIVAVGNFFLRFVTSEPISISKNTSS
mgnify:CR=1 FL=1|jgi:hypothetical protein